MKYVLVKSADCTIGCSYRHVNIGQIISTYTGVLFPSDINSAMKAATHFNDPWQPCKCKVEVKEVGE